MSQPHTLSPSPAFRAVAHLGESERTTLDLWREQLTRIVERCDEVEDGWSVEVREHASSSVLGVLHFIRDLCAPLRSDLLNEAVAAVAPYFPRRGDAREAAREFPAIIAFRDFTHGPPLATDLRGLRAQAAAALALLDTIQEEEEFWTLTPLEPDTSA